MDSGPAPATAGAQDLRGGGCPHSLQLRAPTTHQRGQLAVAMPIASHPVISARRAFDVRPRPARGKMAV